MNGARAYSKYRPDIMSLSWRVALPAPLISKATSRGKTPRVFQQRKRFYTRPTSNDHADRLMTITSIAPSPRAGWMGHGNTDSLGFACCQHVFTLGSQKPGNWCRPYPMTERSIGSGSQTAALANQYCNTFGTEILTRYWWDIGPATPNAPLSSHGSLTDAYHRTRLLCSICPVMSKVLCCGPSSKGSRTECFSRGNTNHAW